MKKTAAESKSEKKYRGDGLVYPIGLYEAVKQRWNRKLEYREFVPPLPDEETFQKIVDVVYHASFSTEEKRRIWFRVVHVSPETMENESKQPGRYLRIIRFDKPRALSVSELVKLAPAADPTQILIGIYQGASNGLEIWGLIEAGTSWWDFGRHEASAANPPPNAFTLSSKNPGQINISREGRLLLILDQGRIVGPSSLVFSEGPVALFLERGGQKLQNEVCRRLGVKYWDRHDDDYPRRFYIYFLERILYRIRERFHGGALLLVPEEMDVDDTRLQDRVVIKYPCHYDGWNPLVDELIKSHDYYKQHFRLWDAKHMTQDEFQQCSRAKSSLEEAEEMVKRAAGFLSSLAAVDGAVVMTDKLRLLGFGAEIVATSPTLDKVKIITDFKRAIGESKDIELLEQGTGQRSGSVQALRIHWHLSYHKMVR